MGAEYIHGYSPAEQDRLVAQAQFWSDALILPGLRYQAGERLLDVGCGVGAVLGVIGTAFPGLRLAGIDRVGAQIDYARRHLARLGHADADLRQGDAAQLPWADGTFDHVTMMWFLEHLPDAQPPLGEALRVLRPGGSITLHETDYTLVCVHPEHPDLTYLLDAQRDLFAANGCAVAGRALGAWLAAAGFGLVENVPMGFHFFAGQAGGRMRAAVDYNLGFIEPMLPRLAAELGRDPGRLRAAAELFGALPDRPGTSFTQIVFRARGIKSAVAGHR